MFFLHRKLQKKVISAKKTSAQAQLFRTLFHDKDDSGEFVL
jgi:hypothetical protein